ncbi:hypothetical protein [Crocosphaera sp.]|uniref:hypothetical protein n=1 Tax=Crocosphaera sp. TaxID=2729996 RepID=UPI002604F288|nr:hypothetical protein [Crocosphaera sp.]MDJ0579057.1 hypothetical protein [Crocosphaera sp.]
MNNNQQQPFLIEKPWISELRKYGGVRLIFREMGSPELICHPFEHSPLKYIFDNESYHEIYKIIAKTVLENGEFLTSYLSNPNKQCISFYAPEEILGQGK